MMISFVIPVYNVEKYLSHCIDSIIAQTNNNWELILVDDGSTDNSGLICDEYASKDARIKVLHKANGGVSSARNLGIEHASGEWVSFIDSDDWISEEYIEQMLTENDTDLVICSYAYVGSNEKSATLPNCNFNSSNIKECLSKYIRYTSFMISCCKMFKREILNNYNLRFNTKVSSGEDTLFIYSYYTYVSSIKIISDELYYYRRYSNESLSRNILPVENVLYFVDTFHNCKIGIEEKFGIDLNSVYYMLLLDNFKRALAYCENKTHSFQEKHLLVKSLLGNHCIKELIQDKNFVPKGRKRSIFDTIARLGLSRVLTLLIHFYHYE